MGAGHTQDDYNNFRLHSFLNYQIPEKFAQESVKA
jgi:transposase InsO family protein